MAVECGCQVEELTRAMRLFAASSSLLYHLPTSCILAPAQRYIYVQIFLWQCKEVIGGGGQEDAVEGPSSVTVPNSASSSLPKKVIYDINDLVFEFK